MGMSDKASAFFTFRFLLRSIDPRQSKYFDSGERCDFRPEQTGATLSQGLNSPDLVPAMSAVLPDLRSIEHDYSNLVWAGFRHRIICARRRYRTTRGQKVP